MQTLHGPGVGGLVTVGVRVAAPVGVQSDVRVAVAANAEFRDAIPTATILAQAATVGIARDAVLGALDQLAAQQPRYVRHSSCAGPPAEEYFFSLTVRGFDAAIWRRISTYADFIQQVGQQIVHGRAANSRTISQALGRSHLLVKHALCVLQAHATMAITSTTDPTHGYIIYIDAVARAYRNRLQPKTPDVGRSVTR